MTKEESSTIVNFIFIGGFMLWRGYISHYSEYAISSIILIYITLIAIVLREFILLTYATVDFHVFYVGAGNIQI